MTGPSKPAKIDPRGPRFGAGITTVVIASAIVLGLRSAPDAGRLDAAGWVMVFAAWMFLWGVVFGPAKHPYGLFFRAVIRPRLAAPAYLEPETPPRFAQGVGLFVSVVGLALHLLAVPYGLVIAAAASSIPSSMFTSRICAPASTCWRATSSAVS